MEKEILQEMYWEEDKNQKEIADFFGKTSSTISYYFNKYGIKTKNDVSHVTKDKLEKLYISMGKTQKECADILDVSLPTIRRRMNKYNIETGYSFDYEYVKKYFKKQDCKLISDNYKNTKTKLKYICKCGNEDKITFESFKQGARCPECAKEKIRNKNRNSYKEVKRFFKNNNCILLSSEYINNEQKLDYVCECGNEHSISFSSFQRGSRCPKCSGERLGKQLRLTQKEFEEKVFEKHQNDLEVIGEYKRDNDHIEVKCKKCNYVWKPQAGSLTQGFGCPVCNESHGEKKIRNYLNDNNIKFKREFSFEDCINKRKLKFDFAVFRKDEIIFLLEYQGKQHYMPRKIFGGEDGFEKQKKRDDIKRNYTKENNIELYEISYKDYENINKIMDKFLTKYDLI